MTAASRDKTARECRAFVAAFSENVTLDPVALGKALKLLDAAANRIDALCEARGRLLDKVLPRQKRGGTRGCKE